MSSRIYAKLAVTNIKNNGKTYVPFMLTAVLTVMMYYIMDSLARNEDIGDRNVRTVLMMALGILTISWAWGKGISPGCSRWRRSSPAR